MRWPPWVAGAGLATGLLLGCGRPPRVCLEWREVPVMVQYRGLDGREWHRDVRVVCDRWEGARAGD